MGDFVPRGYLEVFLVVTTGGGGYWPPLVGGGQRCCSTSCNAQDGPYKEELSDKNVNSAAVEKSCLINPVNVGVVIMHSS